MKHRKKHVHLTIEQKEEILKLVKDPNLTYKEIGDTYNIVHTHVSKLARQAGIIRRVRKPKKLPAPAKHEPVEPEPANREPVSLLEQLNNKYEDITQELHKWEEIKHTACYKIDYLRKARQEHYIALQALQRAKENNNTERKKEPAT